MQSDATSIWVKADAIPDGTYVGQKTGYVVRVETGREIYEIKTRDGVRGFNVPCTVDVRDGMVSVGMCQ